MMSPQPPKTPRSTPVIRDRDERETTAPPPGSPAELALQRVGQRGFDAVPLEIDFHEPTNPHATEMERMVKATGKVALAASGEINLLRDEVYDEMHHVNARLDAADKRAWETAEKIGKLETKAEVADTKLDLVLGFVKKEHEAKIKIETDAAGVDIRLREAQGLDQIESRKWGRSQWGMLFSTILGGTGIVALIFSRISC